MSTGTKTQSRRKFLSLGIASAALLAAAKFFKPAEAPKTGTVKMLGEDGKLVEVDIAALQGSKKKITNGELKNWIKK
jgi:hypothetical protein